MLLKSLLIVSLLDCNNNYLQEAMIGPNYARSRGKVDTATDGLTSDYHE
jgi:hypothetical protein